MGAGGGAVAQLRRRRGEKGMMGVIRRRELAEGCDRVGIETRGVLRPAEMTPEALGMIGVEPHRAADPLDPFLRPAEPCQQLALLHDDEVAVRIEAQRAFLVIGRLVVLVEVRD